MDNEIKAIEKKVYEYNGMEFPSYEEAEKYKIKKELFSLCDTIFNDRCMSKEIIAKILFTHRNQIMDVLLQVDNYTNRRI